MTLFGTGLCWTKFVLTLFPSVPGSCRVVVVPTFSDEFSITNSGIGGHPRGVSQGGQGKPLPDEQPAGAGFTGPKEKAGPDPPGGQVRPDGQLVHPGGGGVPAEPAAASEASSEDDEEDL